MQRNIDEGNASNINCIVPFISHSYCQKQQNFFILTYVYLVSVFALAFVLTFAFCNLYILLVFCICMYLTASTYSAAVLSTSDPQSPGSTHVYYANTWIQSHASLPRQSHTTVFSVGVSEVRLSAETSLRQKFMQIKSQFYFLEL